MIKKALAVLVLFSSMLIGVPAYAAPGCVSNSICFHDTSVSNPFEVRDVADTSTGECHTLRPNITSYITNRTSRVWYVYANNICTSFPAGTIYANSAGPMTGTWNNNIESYKRG